MIVLHGTPKEAITTTDQSPRGTVTSSDDCCGFRATQDSIATTCNIGRLDLKLSWVIRTTNLNFMEHKALNSFGGNLVRATAWNKFLIGSSSGLLFRITCMAVVPTTSRAVLPIRRNPASSVPSVHTKHIW